MILTPARSEPQTTLGGVGKTELQQVTGDAVQTVCGQFVNGPAAVGPLEEDLFDKCGEMVHTANRLNPERDPNDPIANDLGITDDQLAAALQNVAAEEAATTGTMATETSSGQAGNISNRFNALIAGATGFSITGLRFQGVEVQNADATVHHPGQRGGAAGDGGLGANKLGIFINGNLGFGEKDQTDAEDGFDFDTINITLGADYRLSDDFVLGAAIGYNDLQADFNTSATVSGGDVDANGYTLSGYGLYYNQSFYLNGLVSYGQNDYDLDRRIVILSSGDNPENNGADRTATASTDSDQIALSLGGGMELVGRDFTYGPYLRIDYLDLEIDGYSEQGAEGLNLEVDSQAVDSLTSSLGGQVSYNISQAFGVLVPQGRLEWVHEFNDDSRNIVSRYINDPRNNELIARTDDPDENYFRLAVGLSSVFQGGTQAFFNYETVLGLSDLEEHLFTLGVRHAF